MQPAELIDLRDRNALKHLDPAGTFVVICRYMSGPLLGWIEANRASLSGVAYFTDDDISAFVASSEADPGYRLFLFGLAVWPLRRLNRVMDRLWVSTPTLAAAFRHTEVAVLPPAAGPECWMPAQQSDDGIIRIVFHAKAIHETEHAFLVPILREIARLRPAVRIEVSAEGRSLAHWCDVPGITLVGELPWPQYVAQTRTVGADIALVPLMQSRVNATRSDTKRFDVARLGAAGLFSAGDTYGQPDGSAEIVIEADAALWIGQILRLIDDTNHRRRCAEATLGKVRVMAARAEVGFPGLTVGGFNRSEPA